MAADYILLAQSAVTGKGTTLPVYTNPAGTTTYVRQIWFHVSNYGCTGFSETSCILYYSLASGGNAKANPNVTESFFCRSIATNETYLLDCGVPGIVLEGVNDEISLWHRSQTTVNYIMSGVSEAQ